MLKCKVTPRQKGDTGQLNKNLSKTKNQPNYKPAKIQLYLIKRKIPWMRLITSLAVNEFRECLFNLRSANQIGTQLHSWLACSERNRLISSLSQANKKDEINPSFLFTLDAIRTHDLPLRRRLLYPAELPGLTSLILARKFFLARGFMLFIL